MKKRIHLAARDNGAGLTRDLEIVAAALRDAGYSVTATAVGAGGPRRQMSHLQLRARLALRGLVRGRRQSRFDLNIMFERVWRKYPTLAWRSALIPNPEWFRAEYEQFLPSVDKVLTKSRHAVPLFAALGRPTEFIGFTSADRRLAHVEREQTFFHLAGRSGNKGTRMLVELWLLHPEWPNLTIVQREKLPSPLPSAANLVYLTSYLPDDELRVLQNRHLFHLCPSEVEGFGHHIVEGMSTGAIVIATDGPPMNELVGPDRGILVPYAGTGSQRLSTTYQIDAGALANAIDTLLSKDTHFKTTLGQAARDWYEQNDRLFRERLVHSVEQLIGDN